METIFYVRLSWYALRGEALRTIWFHLWKSKNQNRQWGGLCLGEAAKPRVFYYVDVAVCIEEAAKRRVFCSVDVAVSIGEAAQHRVLFAT